jgi:hypothetical protein
MKQAKKQNEIAINIDPFPVNENKLLNKKELEIFIKETKPLPLHERRKRVNEIVDFLNTKNLEYFNRIQYLILDKSEVYTLFYK